MNKLMKLSAAAASIVAAGLLFAPATFAADCTISGNGADSHNTCTISNGNGGPSCHRHRCGGGGSGQINNATIHNSVTVRSNTGGNEANKNTGGDVSITSGDSNVNISITNNVNTNTSGGVI